MEGLKLRYRLTKEEIEETLFCLDWRREGILKSVNLGITSILGVVVLVEYIGHPEQFFLFFLLLMIILLLFYLWYGAGYRRRKAAKRALKRSGSYQVTIGDDYISAGDSDRKTELKDRKLRCYISENMYLLKVDREIYAIPKRILGKEQEEKLVWLMKRYRADTVNIVIKKE